MSSHPFEYVVLRAVPRVDRGEFVNVGVVLYCQPLDFVAARSHVDHTRLRALSSGLDVTAVERALDAVRAICAGEPGAGPAAAERAGVRFRWLASPRSTVVQPGPVHGGVTADPDHELDHLLDRLVR